MEVALKFPKVGVEVAVIAPEELVERIEFTAVPERVREGVEIEEVAMKVEAVTVPPSKKPEPETLSLYPGVVVPMPTKPLFKTVKAVVPPLLPTLS